MTKLECSVRNCMHNSDNYCCKSAILVDGHEAVKPNDTLLRKLRREQGRCVYQPVQDPGEPPGGRV